MELALLVYGISILNGFALILCVTMGVCVFWVLFSALYYSDECTTGQYYSDRENTLRAERGNKIINNGKRVVTVLVLVSIVLVMLPSEKTAYTMVGAYAAQRVAEDPRVQNMSGKVLTIIEQKLDGYIEEGIASVEKKTKGVK